MRIAVCIATYNRPQGLRKCLKALGRLELPAELAAGLSILVIDNSPDGSAEAVTESCRPQYRWPLRRIHEPRKGICHARNAALDQAGDADWIAFIDDDEMAEPDWLWRLVTVQRAHDADVVGGPVLPAFEREPPGWLVAGRFLEPARLADGTPVDTTYTGSVLFRRALVRELGVRFDEKFNLTGGEDVDFFSRLKRGGADLRYCDSAVAWETIPPHRTTLTWLVRRWFRTGNTEALLYLKGHRGLTGRLMVAGRGLLRIVLGLGALTILGLMAGLGHPHRVIARLYTVSRGCGMLSSAVNLHYREYAG